MKDSQSGNALFIILMAVALFAALSYAVTQSGRGDGGIDKERSAIAAAQMVQYATGLQSVVQRMLLTGTSINDLKFCTTGATLCDFQGLSDEVCDSGVDCVFAAEGGGYTVQELPADAQSGATSTWQFLEIGISPSVQDLGTNGAGGEDLLIATRNGVPLEVCEALNRNFGLSISPIASDTDGDATVEAYPNEPFQCFESVASGARYDYTHALVER